MLHPSFGGTAIEWITDGTSTTIFCTEDAGRPAWWTNNTVCTAQPLGLVNHGLPTACSSPPTVNGWVTSNPGGCWGCYNNAHYRVYGSAFSGLTLATPPTATSSVIEVCYFNCTNENRMNIIFSFHPSTGGVAMCDGSAHMLSQSISNLVLLSMVSFRGREPIPDTTVTQ